MLQYAITALISTIIGFGSGYIVFKCDQVELSEIKGICRDDKICVEYAACIVANSKSNGASNQRNCDVIAEAIGYEYRQQVLQKTYEYCAKQEPKEAIICREYIRPK